MYGKMRITRYKPLALTDNIREFNHIKNELTYVIERHPVTTID